MKTLSLVLGVALGWQLNGLAATGCAACGDYGDDDEVSPLVFEKAQTMCGLVWSGEMECYTGFSTLKVSKTSKGKTKWTDALVMPAGKYSFTGNGYLYNDWEYAQYVSQKGYYLTSPMFDGDALDYAWSELYDSDGNYIGVVSSQNYDNSVSALSELKDKTYILELWDNEDRSASLTLTIGSKGVVKVSGKDFNGTSVRAQSTYVTGYGEWTYEGETYTYASIPVFVQTDKAKGCIGFYVYLDKSDDGGAWSASVDSEIAYYSPDYGVEYVGTYLGEVGGLDGYYRLDASEVEYLLEDYVSSLYKESETSGTEAWIDEDLLYCLNVNFSGSKVTTPKAGAMKVVTYKEDGESWQEVECTNYENPIGLKLSYKAKTGAITGSFSIPVVTYTWTERGDDYTEKMAVKKVSVKLSGYAVNGYAYLTATVKGYGSVELYLEPSVYEVIED